MQNLIEYLNDFNSKERFFLVGQVLGNPSFTLAAEFREKLGRLLGFPVPTDALSAMDYHIDWLYASLFLANCDKSNEIYANENKFIKAHQEDIDWLIAFRAQGEYHIVLIEAKAVTNWTNKQMSSKAVRFGEIFGKRGDYWSGVVPHFVLMSPSQPYRLLVEKWPQWMVPNGKILWLELALPRHLRRVCRCDEQGEKNRDGKSWKVMKR
jgi:hypothetical protein